MAETTHTPTPWSYYAPKENDQYGENGAMPFLITSICDLGWNLAAVIGDVPNLPAEANAAFIVRAVNAHDDLVAALKECQAELYDITHSSGDPAGPTNMGSAAVVYRTVVAALTKAGA